MAHLTTLLAAAALIGGAVACAPDEAALADWHARCRSVDDVAAHAERSRQGVSATCNPDFLRDVGISRADAVAEGRRPFWAG